MIVKVFKNLTQKLLYVSNFEVALRECVDGEALWVIYPHSEPRSKIIVGKNEHALVYTDNMTFIDRLYY